MELQDVTKGPGGVTRAAGSLSRADSGLQQGDLSRAWRCRTGVKSHVGGRVYLTRYAERDPDTCSRSTSSVSVAALSCASHPKSGSARKKRAAAHVPGNVRLFLPNAFAECRAYSCRFFAARRRQPYQQPQKHWLWSPIIDFAMSAPPSRWRGKRNERCY